MNTLIQSAIDTWLVENNARRDASYKKYKEERVAKHGVKRRLWASEAGGCPRKAMLRLMGHEQENDFDARALGYMRIGVVLEDETGVALKEVYGDSVKEQFRLENDIWTGKPDFVFNHGEDNVVLMEHKATGEKAWQQHEALPRVPHIAQLCVYWKLYKELYGITPTIILYYRSWGHYAEYTILPENNKITVNGIVDGVGEYRVIDVDIMGMISKLEQYFLDGELPPVLEKKSHGCTYGGKPNCPFHSHCFPQ